MQSIVVLSFDTLGNILIYAPIAHMPDFTNAIILQLILLKQ